MLYFPARLGLLACCCIPLLTGCGDATEAESDAAVSADAGALQADAEVSSDCDGLADGTGRCTGPNDFELCQAGELVAAECAAGTRCAVDTATTEGVTCECDDQADGLCPGAACETDPDCVQSSTEQLVPPELDGVASFAVTDDHLFVVTARGGIKRLLRCAQAGCSAAPHTVDSSVGGTAAKLDVETTGDSLLWLREPKTLMRAELDGSNSAVAYELTFGEIYTPLRGAGTDLYFGYNETGAMVNGVARLRAGQTTGVAGLAGQLHAPVRLAAGGGRLVAWQADPSGAQAPLQVTNTAGTEVSAVGQAVNIPTDGLAITASELFWIDRSATTRTLKACAINNCDTPIVIASDVGYSLTSDGERLFYTITNGAEGVVLSCPVAAAAAGTCTPIEHAVDPAWTNALRLRLHDGHIYGIDERSESVYRAPLAQ